VVPEVPPYVNDVLVKDRQLAPLVENEILELFYSHAAHLFWLEWLISPLPYLMPYLESRQQSAENGNMNIEEESTLGGTDFSIEN